MRSSRPRQRSGIGGRSSGSGRVTFGVKKLRNVTAMPLAMPKPGNAMLSSLASQVEHHDGDGGDEQVHERQRQEDLPGDAHQLVDAYAGKGAAHPDRDGDEDVGLQEEPEDPVQRAGEAAQLGG